MSLTKVIYVDGTTVLYAQNLNDIQDEVILLGSTKQDAENGKGLSTNDYTTAEKTKLENVNNVANLTYVEVIV